ncbi:GGDEF domain-containing protein [Roseateles toxinivorans]|uniref:diguanylate cyclase n=1 Tax=Roseateles toxinivorans TaxID=270368 RepID=A0A4R6QPY5_9BURK|nr:GGDEF domain-containing protein [Roseateles toxinivorans]TDP72950.1 diguanylate cyclase (GGDEF)-like protein [Roseateles toxinivorans]
MMRLGWQGALMQAAWLGLLPLQMAHAEANLEARLDRLVLQGNEQPEAALAQLQALRPELERTPHTQRLAWYAQAQIEASRGSGAAKARALADRLRAQSSEAKLPALAAWADLVGAMVAETAGQIDTTGGLSERALAVLEPDCGGTGALPEACDYRSVWRALRMSERFRASTGARAQSDALLGRSLTLAERAGDDFRLIQSLGAQAVALLRQHENAAAENLMVRAQALAGEDPHALALVKMAQALMSDIKGQIEASLRARLEAVSLAEKAGAVRLAAMQRVNASDNYLKLHRPAEALIEARRALPVVLEFQDQRIERTLRLNMAMSYTAMGQIASALTEMNKGRSLGDPGKAVGRQALELRELGEAMARAGQHRQALALYHEERALSAKAHEALRASAMQELGIKYDSLRLAADLDLLQRDRMLQAEALANHQLARQAWMAVALLMALSVVLAVIMVKRVREANRRLAASHALLRAQSERDPLTDLANRRHFMAVMEQQAAAHFEGALLMVDIDHFKHVNDRHGHAAGDVVICEVARRLNEAVRTEDLVVRWGGEEFLIFAPDVPADQLELLAERVLFKICDTPATLDTGPLDITVSIGFARFPLPPHQVPLRWEQAVNLVDMALYTAKSQGRNRAIGISSVHVHEAGKLQAIESDFEQARQNGLVELQQIVGPVRSTLSTGWAV